MSPKTGKCRAAFKRFFYNKESGDCETFTYGGCDANANNFMDKEACENRCKIPKTLQQPYDDHVIESADKHQQKAAHELEMDNNKDLFSN